MEAFTSTLWPQSSECHGRRAERSMYPRSTAKLQDNIKQKEEKLEEVNIGMDEQYRPLFISNVLKEKEKEVLVNLLKEFIDAFDWSCDEILGLSLALVTRNLAVRLGVTPVKQAPRKFLAEIVVEI